MATNEMCCPKFEPASWDGKTQIWENKLFVREDNCQLFHIPLPGSIGKMITGVADKIQAAGAELPNDQFVWLSFDSSPWVSQNYFAVSKEVPGLKNETISGTFLSKVFDGPYRDVPKWMKQMDAILSERGKKAEKYYFYYTTCPKCAKKWGHNYVVVFAKV